MLIGEIDQKPNVINRTVDDFESYNNATDVDCGSEDIFLQDGCLKKHVRS